jgi:PAS domain S-box-containing protein
MHLLGGTRDLATFMVGAQGHIETWSAAAERVTGYAADDVIGKHVSLLYTPEDVASGEPIHDLAHAEARGQLEREVQRRRRDHTRFPAHMVITAMRAQAGHLRGFVVLLRDLGEPLRADEALRLSDERVRLLVEGVKDYAIFMLDPRGHVVSWNAGAERINGYQAHEIIGEHFSRFYPEADVRSGKCERELATATAEGRFEEEGWRVRKDGTHFWSSVVITALRDATGALIGFAKVTRDLTERQRLDEERLHRAQAEEAIRLRDEFLSIASHELKTPLTALQLQLQGLQRRLESSDENLALRLGRAARAGQRLADLIEALLDVSRIATGRFELHCDCFDLGETVRELVERMRDTAARAQCAIEVSVGESIVGAWDRLRVMQVATNLIDNAIKYGAGRPIAVSLGREDGHAILQVRDRGPGVPEQDLARIFGRFERASSLRNYGGLGLGLYVTREIVEAHGGTVSACNQPDGGAAFIVRLPMVPCAPAESAELH